MGKAPGDEHKRHLDELVDEALKETFPASDSAATGEPTGTEPSGAPKDRLPPVITEEDIEKAQRDEGHTLNDSIERPKRPV